MPRIVTVASQKGGAGKTTICAALGMAAHTRGYTVTLIDLDPQLSLSQWCWDRNEDGFGAIQAEVAEVESGMLRDLRSDFVFIDTPPSHDSESRVVAALKAADLALIPVRPSRLDLGAVARTAGLARSANVPTRYVISQAVPRSSLATQAVTVLSKLGPIAGIIHSRTIFAAAMTDGRTALEVEPRGKAALEINSLWRNIEEALVDG